MKIMSFDLLHLAAVALVALSWFLLRPLAAAPQSVPFRCLKEDEGTFKKVKFNPRHIFGIGLSYAQHIAETAHDYDSKAVPAVFVKANATLVPGGGDVPYPTQADLKSAADKMQSRLGAELAQRYGEIPPLMDYEAELGFILLTDISDEDLRDPAFVPKLGFFIANDLSSRSMQILGEGMPDRLGYWGMSKSFTGFLPVTKQIYVPDEEIADAIPCVALKTIVNGELRQNEKTSGMIYTPRQMLAAARSTYPNLALKKGDLFITGTPGGIALSTPRWKARLASLLRFSRFTKLKFVLKADQNKFLKSGDEVEVSGEWLGKVTSRVR